MDELAKVAFHEEATGREMRAQAAVGESLLEVAMRIGIAIEHTCGGVGACSTCHVRIIQGAESLNQASDAEWDRLDEAPGVNPQSRLACQSRVAKAGNIVCTIPKWNRNAVGEKSDP